MKPLDVLILRVCRGKWERCEVGTWLTNCFCQAPELMVRHLLGRLIHGVIDGEPTTAARNSAVAAMKDGDFDVVFMVDADMDPSPTFFKRAVEFLNIHRGPVVIGSPYCGARPARAVQVTRLNDFERNPLAVDLAKRGEERVGCIGTGLIACRTEAFDLVPPPWFDYEYTDPRRGMVAKTEDFFFTRRLTEAGGKVFAAWDHWSSHCKEETIGKPEE